MTSDRRRFDDEHFERTEGFRETMLANFPPKEAKALKRLARMLFAHALEASERRLPRKGSWTAGNLDAAVCDLTHLGRFLRSVGDTALEESGLAPGAAARLARAASRAAHMVTEAAKELDDALREKVAGHAPRA